MIHFKLDSNWKILSVIRCSNSHATLSVQHIYSGEIKVLSIYAKEHFQHKLYFDISHIKHRHLLPISQIQLKHGWRLVYFPMLTPLKDYIRSNALSLSDILSLAHQLCSALEILHQHNILHLDVSPDNIFVDYDGSFVLGDYSSSRYVFQNNWDNYFTPHFAPPEYQLFKPSIQSDLYSFAVLLFGLLHNGMIPDNIASLSLSDYADYQKKMETHGISYPMELYSCFQKALHTDVHQRYHDVTSFVDNLEQLLHPLLALSSYHLQLIKVTEPFFNIRTTSLAKSSLKDTNCPKNTANSPFHFAKPHITLPIRFDFHRRQRPVRSPKSQFFKFSCIHKILGISICCAIVLLFFVGSRLLYPFRNQTSQNTYPESETEHNFSAKTASGPSIEILDISNKQASTIAELCNEQMLEQNWSILYGENNRFSSVDELSDFSNTKQLFLSGNKISSLESLENLTTLETLIISDNSCTDLLPISNLKQLKVLDLSGNQQLASIDCLASLTKLQTLILSDTSVDPASIKKLQVSLPTCNIIY